MPITSCPHETAVSVYIPDMNIMIYTMSPQALVYIHFTLLTNAPEQICMPHCICIYCCITSVTTYKLHISAHVSNLVGCELSSNMLMYYVFGNHIYPLSSMSTHFIPSFVDMFFSVFMPIILEIVHMYNGCEVLS